MMRAMGTMPLTEFDENVSSGSSTLYRWKLGETATLNNANFSLTSPYGDFGFMTPISQKNYAYSCFHDQTVDYSRVTGSPFIRCNFP